MALRELAWRVTTRELESSLEEERGEGERSASYLISPFGARMNRVVLAGTLSAAESIGREAPTSFWRSRLSDPTGAVAVTAGSFQPRAMAQLRSSDSPRSAVVVGKTHLFRGRDGVGVVSVRAEGVRTVGEVDERTLLADVVRQTLDRLDLIERVRADPTVSDASLRADGAPRAWVRAAREAIRRYPDVDRAAFRRELGAAVRRVAGDSGPQVPAGGLPATVRVTRAESPPERRPPTAAERAEEAAFLDVVDDAAEHAADGYADLTDVMRSMAARGIAADRAEAILNRLEESGAIEEPLVGKLRRAE